MIDNESVTRNTTIPFDFLSVFQKEKVAFGGCVNTVEVVAGHGYRVENILRCIGSNGVAGSPTVDV